MYKFVILLVLLQVVSYQAFGLFGLRNRFRQTTQKSNRRKLSLSPNFETKWIEQPLDHFNEQEQRTWQMRYFENLQFWKPNSTIYLMIGGEGEATPDWIPNTLMFDLVNETGGAIIASEHRYYGESIPLNTTITANLKFLSSKQALADLAYLIMTLRASPQFAESTASKVIVFGGSYSGNLAAWMRLIYPDIVVAAVASSAPVLAQKDFYEYIETVNVDFELYGERGCLDKISEKFRRYETLFESDEGIAQLKKEENICLENDLTIIENKQLFFYYMIGVFMRVAQYGNPKAIKTLCKNINSSRIDITKFMYGFESEEETFENECQNVNFTHFLKDSYGFTWFYQTCTEFGYFQTTNSYNQPFTKNTPISFFIKICRGLYGPEFDEKRIDRGIDANNKLFGGLTPNVTKVLFINGDMDPWSRLGVLEDLSNEAPAIVIARSSHCEDMSTDIKDTTEELLEAQNFIKTIVKQWLGFGENLHS